MQATITSAPAIIRQAIRLNGPQTTLSLHTLLHANGTPLPARPAPLNFLAGHARLEASRGIIPKRSTKLFAGQNESANGIWSITYLKKKVLKDMEGRGELVKMTRGKWIKLSTSVPSEDQSDAEVQAPAVTQVEAVEAAPVVASKSVKGKASISAAAKEAEQHVWCLQTEVRTYKTKAVQTM